MAEFLTTKGIANAIEKIIIDAQRELVLVSPYIQISETFLKRLKYATKNGVQVKIIYGKEKLKPTEISTLTDLAGLELYFFKELHAKCYYNESKMVISSMNLYDFSEKTNWEMGISIESKEDSKIYNDAIKEVRTLFDSSNKVSLFKNRKQSYNPNKFSIHSTFGFCIRCKDKINYNPNTPYCINCYQSWSKYENPFHEEKVCHRCGKPEDSTMQKPQCYSCYSATTM